MVRGSLTLIQDLQDGVNSQVVLSQEQTENMLHALGLKVRGEFIVPHKRYRPLAKSSRNHFQTSADESWEDLVSKNLANKFSALDLNFYRVTSQGIAYLKDTLGYQFVYNG